MNKLASIITPVYNGKAFVHRFLDSVLAQTYDNIELIIINDGSTDCTEIILYSYKERFFNRKINYIIIKQENKGQSEAINQGLKIFEGDYLTWLDSDDILKPKHVESKVAFLEVNKDCGMVISGISVVDENDIDKELYVFKRNKPKGKDTIFEDLIKGKNVCYMGAYMLRSSCFLKVNPERSILSPQGVGQNYQLLLPISYRYKCGYLDEVLYTYVVRRNSHSHSEKTFEDSLSCCNIGKVLLEDIIKLMKISDEDYYMKVIQWRYIHNLMDLSIIYKDLALLEEQIKILKKYNMLAMRDLFSLWEEKYLIVKHLLLIYRKTKKILKKIMGKK